ncbi:MULTISPECIES: hypothetical protein [Haloferax]|uniref:Uncharacterized protein n=1 Tax=Haloferax marinum TaxID=2666143 RepID=A0A6A8GAD9_9EURY|nr:MULTISPECIES: hypothetical protein [Haloferax]KAB1190651.1 hypothetical protein Hfx1150_16565 [Haloferax sp. CBA1150]MRW98180.1 hypothetical protein [Haloferax marinum]
MDISLSFLIPLIMLIVVNLAESAREVDVIGIFLEADRDVYLFHLFWLDKPVRLIGDYTYVLDKVLGDNDQPTFGRLNLIHWLNVTLVGASLLLIVFTATGVVKYLLGFIIVVFWMALPLLEIEEYDHMMRTFTDPLELRSLSVHVVSAGVLGAIPLLLTTFEEGMGLEFQIGFSAVYMMLVIGQVNLFLEELEDEFVRLKQRGVFDGYET